MSTQMGSVRTLEGQVGLGQGLEQRGALIRGQRVAEHVGVPAGLALENVHHHLGDGSAAATGRAVQQLELLGDECLQRKDAAMVHTSTKASQIHPAVETRQKQNKRPGPAGDANLDFGRAKPNEDPWGLGDLDGGADDREAEAKPPHLLAEMDQQSGLGRPEIKLVPEDVIFRNLGTPSDFKHQPASDKHPISMGT